MRRRSFLGLLFVFTLVSLLLLPLQRHIVAAPSPPLAQQSVPLQQAVDVHSSSTLQPDSTAAVLPFYPSDDATVQEGAPSSTDPSNLYLGAGYNQSSFFPFWADGRIRSYMWFDLSSLPAGSTVISATLRLYHVGGVDYPDQTANVTFYRATENWNEATVTWNNRPGYAESLGSVSTTYDFKGWVTLDLTAQVLAWVRGTQNNYGLVAIGPEGTPGVCRLFASGESNHSPELHVRYLPAPPPVLDVWPGTLSARASSTQPPPALSLQVSNVTNDSLEWSASKLSGATWLALSKSSGSATPTTPDSLSLIVDPSGLTLGTYTEQIRISSSTPNVEGSPLTVTFTLEVVDHLSNIYLPLVMSGEGDSGAPSVVALVVGIADYQNLPPPPPGLANLPDGVPYDLVCPYYDVIDVVSFVQNQVGAPSSNVIQRTESAATRDSVIAAFGELDQKEERHTTVIFYYSGHGGQIPDDSGDESDGYDEFIGMYDLPLILNGSQGILTDDDLEGLLANLESEHIVVIIDTCYSGGMMETAVQAFSDLRQRGLVNDATKPNVNAVQGTQAALADLVGSGRVIITAGTGDQTTWESPTLGNGVFTYFFLEGLQDSLSDANQNSRISVEEAYWFTRDVVDDWVVTNVITTPTPHQNPDISDRHFGQVDLR
jgi:hypothetical protein